MKTIPELLSYFRSLDIRLWAEEGRLRFNAPKGALTPELREQLKARKAEILDFLHQVNQASAAVQTPPQPIERVPRDQDLPLSFNQQRLWFMEQLEGANFIYNIPMAWQITGPLDVDVLEKCVTEIVRRHEALRTIFPEENDTAAQHISAPQTVRLPVVDLRHLPDDELTAEARRCAFEEIEILFNLAEGPLFRGKLLRLRDDLHIFVFIVHHIVFDVWSIGVFVQELSALYKAFSSEQASPLPELSIQYADFANWQNTWLAGDILEQQLAYWEKKLSSSLPILELPTDYPRPPVYSFRGDVHSFILDDELVEAVKAFAQKEGVTLFILLLTVYKVLLYRYSGQTDIIVGAPIAGRTRPELAGLIGFFVNTMVLRNDLSGEPTFLELLGRVKRTALDAYAHQDVPFQVLVEKIHPDRSLSHPPLFQVSFILQNSQQGRLEIPGLEIVPFKGERNTSGVAFDLNLTMEETISGLMGVLEYNKNLFDASTIERMAGHFQTLLAAIVANPNQPISQLPLLSDAERHQLLVEWNDTNAYYPDDKCFHQLVEEQVERTPDAVAAVFEQEQLTYRELNRRANQLAHYLRKLGVKREDLIGICIDRSLEMVVGILGILKSGGAYVPLDPVYPQDRLTFMLEDSQVPVLLTQKHVASGLPAHKAHTICLDSDWPLIAGENTENPDSHGLTPENLAYVIYTSGSTGRPKGTLIAHRGLCNVAYRQIQRFQLGVGDTVLQLASLSFDAAVFEFSVALASGARLCLGRRESLLPGPNLLKVLQEYDVSFVLFPPSALANLPADPLPALRTLTVGGEACSADLVARWSEGRSFFNLYGPTESTILGTTIECTDSSKKPPIGRPIDNSDVYVLDSHLQPVPIGVPGELHIGGVSLARGYLNRPELTAEKFIPHPFRDEPGARLYKTGDLVCYLPDGNIEYLGRIDHQVKVRGFRIELGEIESVLASFPAVREAAVIVREDQPGNKRLVAYVVFEHVLESSELRALLKETLPEYMIPSAFVALDALPLTSNNKVDRRALPAPERAQREDIVAPRNELEQILADIWTDVLKQGQVGIHDNFFELGGHSLLAVQLTTKIQQQFGKECHVASLFQSPTIAQFAHFLEQQEASSVFTPLVHIQPGGKKMPFFGVHPGNGQVFCYNELSQGLGTEQPFYGLQALGLEESTAPLTSVQEMAATYLDAIRSVQPHGPYLLGGFCIGGTIAYEMAQQLQSQGEHVAMLVLLDTLAPHAYSPLEDDVQLFMMFGNELGKFFGTDIIPLYCEIRGIDFNKGIEEIRRDLETLSSQERLHVLAKCAKRAGIPLPEENTVDYLNRVVTVHKLNANAVLNYAPQPYDGRIVFLRAEHGLRVEMNMDEPTLGWGRYSSTPIDVYDTPGDHYSMLRQPHVKGLAETLKGCFEKL